MRSATARTLDLMVILVSTASQAGAQGVQGVARLAWDPNPESDLAGYVVDYGTAPGQYLASVDVGLVTEAAIPSLREGVKYYFTVRAYNTQHLFSPRSMEVSFVPPTSTELLWQNTRTGALGVWTVNGRTQVSATALGPGAIGEQGWRIVGTGDFNGDRARDVLWQHLDGRLATWLMNGSALLEPRMLQPDRVPDLSWRIGTVADLDADGHSDILWQHGTSGTLASWLMNGTAMRAGVYLSPSQVADVNWRIVGSADFNGDRAPDLLWYHRSQGVLAVWFMSGTQMTGGVILSAPQMTDLRWWPVAVQDLDSDGDPDVFWQHDDGRLSAWILTGTAYVAGLPLIPDRVADTDWRITTGR